MHLGSQTRYGVPREYKYCDVVIPEIVETEREREKGRDGSEI